jgi:hypothetical protein
MGIKLSELKTETLLRAALIAVAALVFPSCERTKGPPAEAPPFEGIWLFHSLNGQIGAGPNLNVSGGLFELEGCGRSIGTVSSRGAGHALTGSEATACTEKDRLLSDRLISVTQTLPEIQLVADKGCENARALQIRTLKDVVIFCALPPTEE